ncbi:MULTISPECIES: energy transducer TonB [Butyricimonas]|uniref:Energy transducer TonB n=1 Tax=Butyricimonas hominis TaxID=2763032 RepID=A0ABR7CW36_9BACT|nr:MULTISPECIES: energy transducer TonB [Butyricimonas]MBC5619555.1 energy transducer TonB [Butyricimonas hominis]MCB6972186.1 energy transducer TonB [Butyricimonas synergistica]MCG4519251.1 energy transducer TonB [Butyricimonas sp. DFI.6.44]
MEIKKTPKADLEGKKGIFFEIGLVVALGILLCAFNWKANTKVEEGFVTVAEEPVEEEIIPITQQMMKPPPPPPPAPKLTDLIEIVDQELDIDEELEIEDVEANVENRTDYSYDYDGTGYDEGDYGEEDIFQVVEDMPTFPGDINKWLGKNVKYPVIAQENNIQGRVTVQFVIERDGSITDVKVLRGVDPSLDKEAVRVVKSMPKWKPGKQRGKPVRVSYTVPINFRLQ